MTAEVTNLVLAVDSRQVRTGAGDLDRLSAAGKRAEGATGGLAASFRGLGAAVGIGLAIEAARRVIATADAYQALNSRLRLVTTGTREFVVAQEAVFAISQRTRTGLKETTDLYGSLARSTESLGVSQSDVLGVTETINQAIQISGTSAQGAAAALVQLGQGFASGVLRGEELNSVLEQAPRLAKGIADGLGVPIGQLRKLGEEGKLTAEKVFGALQKSGVGIGAEFSRLPLTVGGSVTQVGNALSKLIGVIDETNGATSSLAGLIGEAAQAIGQLANEIKRGAQGAEDIGLIAEAFLSVGETLRVLASDVSFVFTGIGKEIGGIAAQIAALARLDLRGFTAISDAMRDDAARARVELDKFQADVLRRAKPLDTSVDDAESARFKRQQVVPRQAARATGGGSKRDPFADAVKGLREQIGLIGQLTELDQINARIQLGNYGKISQAQQASLRGLAAEVDFRKNIEAEREAGLSIDLAGITRQLDGLTGAYRNSEQILEALREAGLTSEKDYYESRRAFIRLNEEAEVAALQAANNRLSQERATGADRVRNLQQIADNTAKIKAIRDGAATQLTALSIKEQSALDAVTARFKEAEAAAKDYLNTLKRGQSVELGSIGLGNQERGRRQGRAQIEDRFSGERQRLESERRQRNLQDGQFADELDRINRFQRDALSSYDDYYAELLRKQSDFGLGASEALANYASEAANVFKQTEQIVTNAFQGMEDALVKFVSTGKLDLKSLAQSISNDINRAVIKQNITGPLAEAANKALGIKIGPEGGKADSLAITQPITAAVDLSASRIVDAINGLGGFGGGSSQDAFSLDGAFGLPSGEQATFSLFDAAEKSADGFGSSLVDARTGTQQFLDILKPASQAVAGMGQAGSSAAFALQLLPQIINAISGSGGGGGLGSLFANIAGGSGSNGSLDFIGDLFIKSFGLATGTNYVPYDGFKATLHKGEAVIPAKFNPAMFAQPAAAASNGGDRPVNIPITINMPPGSTRGTLDQAAATMAREARRAFARGTA